MYDPEFEVYTSDVASEALHLNLKTAPEWFHEFTDFQGAFVEAEIHPTNSLFASSFPGFVADDTHVISTPTTTTTTTSAAPFLNAKFVTVEEAQAEDHMDFVEFGSRLGSPVPEDDGFPSYSEPLSPAPSHEVPVAPAPTKKVTSTSAAPKKVASHSKIPPKAKEKVATTSTVFSRSVSPVKEKDQKISAGGGSLLTEEERKERNKVAAQKYRQKCREQANDAQIRCNELIEEQKKLQLQVAQEMEKIREIRDLLEKHGLLPVKPK